MLLSFGNMLVPNPRVLVICVFRNGSRILAARGFDKQKAEHFFRPIGGAVEFGETTTQAIRREVKEELGVEIDGVKRLGVLENLFRYNGKPSHEIVFVFDASFVDNTLYDAIELPIQEDVWVGPAAGLISMCCLRHRSILTGSLNY